MTIEQTNANLQKLIAKIDKLEKLIYDMNNEIRVSLLNLVDILERANQMPRTSDLRRRLKEAKQENWALRQTRREL